MTDQDSFNAGRQGGHAGSGTDMEAFRRGQNARRIELDNAKSASTSYLPKDRGGSGGGGASTFGLLMILPFLVSMAVFALLPAWLLKFTLQVPEGQAPLTWFKRYKTALFVVVAFNALPALVLATGGSLGIGAVAAAFLAGLALAGFVMKQALPGYFNGPGSYWRACRSALLVSVTANVVLGLLVGILWFVLQG